MFNDGNGLFSEACWCLVRPMACLARFTGIRRGSSDTRSNLCASGQVNKWAEWTVTSPNSVCHQCIEICGWPCRMVIKSWVAILAAIPWWFAIRGLNPMFWVGVWQAGLSWSSTNALHWTFADLLIDRPLPDDFALANSWVFIWGFSFVNVKNLRILLASCQIMSSQLTWRSCIQKFDDACLWSNCASYCTCNCSRCL